MTNTAGWHDAIVNLAAHPVGWSLARLARRLPPVFSVPGFGVVVNDAEFAHQVLVRDDLFTKNGEGSLSSIMTELLGPLALGNMDGEAGKYAGMTHMPEHHADPYWAETFSRWLLLIARRQQHNPREHADPLELTAAARRAAEDTRVAFST